MDKKTVYLCQVNYKFDDQVFIPYSTGLLQAYCQQFDEINDHYIFRKLIYSRDDIEGLVRSLEFPSIVGLSCYIWNWEYNKRLADKIKTIFPDCLVLMGGPQVPQSSGDFFVEHPYVDILVHNEGEIVFSEILRANLREPADYSHISGLSIRINGTNSFATPPRERIIDINAIPSPYLSGVFDHLMQIPHKWNASHETNRGCPYSCTFCDWGSAIFTKLRTFDIERLRKEFEWFAKHHIEVIYNCDANYGLLDRDYQITELLTRIKAQFGYPTQFRTAFAKTNTANILEISKLLREANLQKGITLSTQSMDEQTLNNVKRKNLRNKELSSLLGLFRTERIPSYTELLIGLPGETYQSFKEGVDLLLRLGQHDGLCIYLCMVLPNSEMADPKYPEKHGIKTNKIPLMLAYANLSDDDITEYSEIIIETNTMPLKDWKRSVIFGWAVQCFHCLNLTQYLALFMKTRFKVSYAFFYEQLIEFARSNSDTLLGGQYEHMMKAVEQCLEGQAMTELVRSFGEISWFPEEKSFLEIISQKDRFYEEIRKFLDNLVLRGEISLPAGVVEDLISFQRYILADPYSPPEFTVRINYDWESYFSNAFFDRESPIVQRSHTVTLTKEQDYRNNLPKYALDIVRYGRKSNRLHHKIRSGISMLATK